MKIKNLMILGMTIIMVGIVIITSLSVILIQGNMSRSNNENTLNAKKSLEEEIGMGAANTAIKILNSLDGIVADQVMMVKTWARTPIVIETAKNAMNYTMEELYDRWSNTTTRQYDEGEAMGDGDPDNDINSDASNFLITLSKESNGAYPEIFFTDARGYAVAASGATGDFDQGPDDWKAFSNESGGPDIFMKHKPNADGEGWWAGANAANDSVYVGPVEYDYSARIWGTDICVVIMDDINNIGVLKAVYNFALALSSVIDVSKLGADEIKIIDDQGLIVATSETNKTKIMNPEVTVFDLNSYVDAKLGNIGYTVEVDEDGEEVVIGYTADIDDHRYCLVSHKTSTSLAPIKEIGDRNDQLMSDINLQVILSILIEIIIAIIILIGVAFILNIRLTKPLVDMADKAKKIQEGNLNVSVDEQGDNEISELAKAFNQMAINLAYENSERKMAEKALRRAHDDLENQVQERTIELRHKTKELERSNAELEQFAYVASHDMQEPLRMVSSYVQLLGRRYKDKLDKDADEFIAYAVDGATRMQQLINDLLTYSRVGTKGKPFEPTDSETVFKLATDNLKVAIEESGAVITHNSLPNVMADSSQLIQLLQNLIGNGIKFRGEEPLKINVSAAKKENEWLFSVSDNGIGIDPKHKERIFQIFQRLHSSNEYQGTGIGLAVSKKIVERHGGRIWVESEPGKGSTFYFTIPKIGGKRL